MKKIILLLVAPFMTQFLPAQKFSKTVLFDNQDVEVVLLCRDTASIDQPDWMKLNIKNKTAHSIVIMDGSYAIHDSIRATNGEAYFNYGRFGQANKYDLFHFYYDLKDASGHRDGIELLPHAELSSWKYLTNYASVLIPGNTPPTICPLFQLKLTYTSAGQSNILEEPGKQFCFAWKPDSLISNDKLVKRLQNTLTDAHFRWANTSIVSYLIGKPEVVGQISSEAFINAVLLREYTMTADERILFLNELHARKAIPDKRLTTMYKQDLQRPSSLYSEDLIYYWDNDLLDDLLKSQLNLRRVCQILEANAPLWSSTPENRDKVYAALAAKLPFTTTDKPNAENFRNWSNSVKLMSISRDQKIIDYLAPLLENEQVFSAEDWSKYRGFGIRPTNAQPDTIAIRVCDIAFVSLLRAIGQTTYVTDAQIGTKYFRLVFKSDILDTQGQAKPAFMHDAIDYNLALAEKFIKLTPALKMKVKDYLKSRQ